MNSDVCAFLFTHLAVGIIFGAILTPSAVLFETCRIKCLVNGQLVQSRQVVNHTSILRSLADLTRNRYMHKLQNLRYDGQHKTFNSDLQKIRPVGQELPLKMTFTGSINNIIHINISPNFPLHGFLFKQNTCDTFKTANIGQDLLTGKLRRQSQNLEEQQANGANSVVVQFLDIQTVGKFHRCTLTGCSQSQIFAHALVERDET